MECLRYFLPYGISDIISIYFALSTDFISLVILLFAVGQKTETETQLNSSVSRGTDQPAEPRRAETSSSVVGHGTARAVAAVPVAL